MRLIKPSVEILEQGPGLQGIYDMIELCGKTSYKSEVKGGEEAKKFVDARINEGHYAVLEFGTVYMCVPVEDWEDDAHEWEYMFPENLPWVSEDCDGRFIIITTNFRHIIERVGVETMKKYLCDYPINGHTKRYCARFITDRGVSHELVRHRSMSFVQESTRYCNYSKDRFGNELTFIKPSEMEFRDPAETGKPFTAGESLFIKSCREAEENYMEFLNRGFTPQQARAVLPNAIKTEICVCGFEDAWKHFFRLRTSFLAETGKPHPDMSYLADTLYTEFVKRKFIEPLV